MRGAGAARFATAAGLRADAASASMREKKGAGRSCGGRETAASARWRELCAAVERANCRPSRPWYGHDLTIIWSVYEVYLARMWVLYG